MSDEHAAAATGDHADRGGHFPHVNYWVIFGLLCGLTVVSWLADEMSGRGWLNKGIVLTFIVLAVACAKALFVMMYFMHLKFEGRWKFVLLAPTIILAMAIPAALMPDIGSHYYDYAVPQMRQTADSDETGHGPEASGDHGAAPQGH